ncbi:hypothetical protein BCR35DRAFT_309705 [Leucosporidium creatinivorum]|uniref:Uncharacterized protein n=1 Tax=Leucosporidium creatinivorum TaxID=106004 RepID=A0A1Y2DDC2_9BASI|nr:hypothetical protein BCR35DRAFT_309705 [Leucosporidium creatinivorum]
MLNRAPLTPRTPLSHDSFAFEALALTKSPEMGLFHYHSNPAAPTASSSGSDSDSSSASLPQQRTARTFKERPHHPKRKQHNRRHPQGRVKIANAYSDSDSSSGEEAAAVSSSRYLKPPITSCCAFAYVQSAPQPVSVLPPPVIASSIVDSDFPRVRSANGAIPSEFYSNVNDPRARTLNVFQPRASPNPLPPSTSFASPSTNNSSPPSLPSSSSNLSSPPPSDADTLRPAAASGSGSNGDSAFLNLSDAEDDARAAEEEQRKDRMG